MSPKDLDVVLRILASAVELARAVFSSAAIDRSEDSAALRLAVLGLLGWAIRQGECVRAGLEAGAASGAAPNVRSLLEPLLTARYLTDPAVSNAEREDRLDRYYRGVRREQLKLRDALEGFPTLKKVYLTNPELAEWEKAEYRKLEGSLPAHRKLNGNHWSGLPEGLKAVADAVGMGSDYAIQYRLHSGSAHGNRPWDEVIFDDNRLIIVPDLNKMADTGISLGFHAFRYLAWLLVIGFESGAVQLSGSQQAELQSYRKYLEPIDELYEKG